METEENALGTCRLPYTLLKDGIEKEKGYLLSSKDVCTLDILPKLINAGVKSFKIEGRMKSKEYVGIVTAIYRKYIDLAKSNKEYIVDEKDREILLQIFNRGGFSTGYLNGKLGKEMMYTKRPNHMGVLVGKVVSYNPNKGHVKVKLNNNIDLLDSIQIGNASCRISELMIGKNNIKTADAGREVTIGRIKGKMFKDDKVYKTVSQKLNKQIEQKISIENIKRPVNAKIYLKENEKIRLELIDVWSKIEVIQKEDTLVNKANNKGLDENRIKEQLSKTGNTVFKMEKIEVIMDKDIIVPISTLNNLRRKALEVLENKIIDSFKKNKKIQLRKKKSIKTEEKTEEKNIEVTVVLNEIKDDIDYLDLKNIDNIYIPFKFFLSKKEKVSKICKKFNSYILLPNITKENYEKIIKDNLNSLINENIKGIVISNISHLELLNGIKKRKESLEIVANYTLNIANNYTIEELKKIGISKYIVSPESDKEEIQSLSNEIKKEVIVYGRVLLMTSEYCTIGTYKNCKAPCEKAKYVLKDRMGFEFPIYTDRINCNNLIYNSKITSINWNDLSSDSIRIDILEESKEEIQNIIDKHKKR